MTLIGALLLVVGSAGTLGSILYGAPFLGQWTVAVAVAFVIIGVAGASLITPRR
ncbi:hypothetical protein ACFWPA_18490 [Rhodococcus sp. NPDC058505]|uniref:hypothetical protein n=1 Tax=unclassified Rhodococcus (in: high G+C Gram-positive bacteria) TaxID=192944 RepID=UPI003655341A